MEYYENLRRLRKQENLTQEQLAENIGVSRQTVARWENGWNVPSFFYAEKLSRAFGVTVSELMNSLGGENATISETKSGSMCDTKSGVKREKPLSVFPVVLVAVLSFLPAIFHGAFVDVIKIIYWNMNFIQKEDYVTIETAYNLLKNLNNILCFALILSICALWIAHFIDRMRETCDKYLRYNYYRRWRVGQTFWLTNVCFLGAEVLFYGNLLFWGVVTAYVGALLIALMVDWIIDVIFNKFAKKYMVTENNERLKKLNNVFIIIAAAIILLFMPYMIYCNTVGGAVGMLSVNFLAVALLIFALVAELCYLLIRRKLLGAPKKSEE